MRIKAVPCCLYYALQRNIWVWSGSTWPIVFNPFLSWFVIGSVNFFHIFFSIVFTCWRSGESRVQIATTYAWKCTTPSQQCCWEPIKGILLCSFTCSFISCSPLIGLIPVLWSCYCYALDHDTCANTWTLWETVMWNGVCIYATQKTYSTCINRSQCPLCNDR